MREGARPPGGRADRFCGHCGRRVEGDADAVCFHGLDETTRARGLRHIEAIRAQLARYGRPDTYDDDLTDDDQEEPPCTT